MYSEKYQTKNIGLENIITSQPTISSLLTDTLPCENPIEVLTQLTSVNIIFYDVRKRDKTIRKYFIDNLGKNLFVGSEDEDDDGICCFSRGKARIVFKVWGSNEIVFFMIISNSCFSNMQIIKITTPSSDFIGSIKQTGRGSNSSFEIENSKKNQIFSVIKSKEDVNFNFDVLHKESEQMTKMQITCSNGLPCRTVLYPNGIALEDRILLTVCGILISNIPVKVKNNCERKYSIEDNNQLRSTTVIVDQSQQMINRNNNFYEPYEDDCECEAILRLCCIQHYYGNSNCCDDGNSNCCDDGNSNCCDDGNTNCCDDGNANECCGDGVDCNDGVSCCDCN